MVESAPNAEGGGPPDAVAPRPGRRNNNKQKTPQKVVEDTGKRDKLAETQSKLKEIIVKGVAGYAGLAGGGSRSVGP
jgi:hypothetical protein